MNRTNGENGRRRSSKSSKRHKKSKSSDNLAKNEELLKSINLNVEYEKTTRLNLTFTPTLTEEEQKKYLEKNQIKLLGENIPPIAATFEELNLPQEIMEVIKENNWTNPTPIQSLSIPIGLKSNDMVGIAKTGSGKTASFLIPALMHISAQRKISENDGPIVLILSPTRELALQTDEVAAQFCVKMGYKHVCIYGGEDRHRQINKLRFHPEIVTATPGRLIDFLQNGVFNPNRANFLVLDEADRMLDMGFEPQIRAIIASLTKDRETFMFSATWPKEIRQLASDFLSNPIHMHVGGEELATNERIQQNVLLLQEHEKGEKCVEVLKENQSKKIIIFAKTKRTVQQLSDFLKSKSIRCLSIHGDKSQQERIVALEKFKNARTGGVLVATDVAARGLDVTDIDLVLNYDFPGDIEDYVHRIGRTARGEKTGVAITFFTDENRFLASDLVEVIKNSGQVPPDWLSAMAVHVTKSDGQPMAAKKVYNPRDGNGFGSEADASITAFGQRSDGYGSFGFGYGGPNSYP